MQTCRLIISTGPDDCVAGARWGLWQCASQWTDRFVDAHTAKAVLRGGSRYLPVPSWVPSTRGSTLVPTPGNWYFPNPMHCLDTPTLADGPLWWRNCPANAGPLVQHNLLLLLSDSMDRSAGIGFRCVVDAAPPNCTTPWAAPHACPAAAGS